MIDEALRRGFAEETLGILTDAGAILADDHFVYISGDHGSGWIDKDAIYPHTKRIETLCRDLARLVGTLQLDVICGPATGGLIMAEWMAHELGCLATFTEHDTTIAPGELRGRFVLRRGYDRLVHGKRVLIVDDIVNQGHSLRQTAEAVRQAGADVVGAATLVTRGNVNAASLGVDPFIALLEYKIPAWSADRCHLCEAGVPVNTTFAHGREFVASRGHRPVG
jgi:orotate phosphoribosyltransferase